MKRGYLADHFIGVGVKRLSSTEVDPQVSNGHEFQGTRVLQAFLGMPVAKHVISTRYLWLTDEEAPETLDSTATWYDSRINQPHRNPEPRLLYTAEAEPIVYRARDGDSLFVCLTRERHLLVLICRSGSDIERQLLWLFGLQAPVKGFAQAEFEGEAGGQLSFAARKILDEIGVEVEVADDNWLDLLTERFGRSFPATAVFSAFAREHTRTVDLLGDPDQALMDWIETEEAMFYAFERHLISERIAAGFVDEDGSTNVDGFVSFSLSVQNRRKSRAGYSLENHLVALFARHDVAFDRGAKTEGNKKPDFLFPSGAAYHDPDFDPAKITLLGSKSSCKDRWRQVLSEGNRARAKHLVTLEPSISLNQTNEMIGEGLQLVVPRPIQLSYLHEQQDWLLSLKDFLDVVKARARRTD
ncbi:type II restriction endonuclease [Brevundimonas sp. NPDC092305]|uniref:type II restriction endonuclease n=1 Tax=Brevundimonas sp. NPDC092305 TaxID=3363957 RepID=UPI00382C2A25